jgi:protein TonB
MPVPVPPGERRRLLAALAASLALHCMLLASPGPALFQWPKPLPLAARLAMPAVPEASDEEPFPVTQQSPAPATEPPPGIELSPARAEATGAPRDEPASAAPPRREIEAAQARLAQHGFYPPEALAQGIEGEVRVLVRLDAGQRITATQVIAGSGHAVLDQAALRAVRSLGRIEGAGTSTLVLPVIFRLE